MRQNLTLLAGQMLALATILAWMLFDSGQNDLGPAENHLAAAPLERPPPAVTVKATAQSVEEGFALDFD